MVEKYSCSSDQKDYMFSDYTEISNGKLRQSTAYNNSDSNSHSIVGDLVSFYRWETSDKHVTKLLMYVLVYHWRNCQSIWRTCYCSYIPLDIYSKGMQSQTYNQIKESLDHRQILVHANYHWVAPRLAHPFLLQSLINWVQAGPERQREREKQTERDRETERQTETETETDRDRDRQNYHWVAPRSAHPFSLQRLIN